MLEESFGEWAVVLIEPLLDGCIGLRQLRWSTLGTLREAFVNAANDIKGCKKQLGSGSKS